MYISIQEVWTWLSAFFEPGIVVGAGSTEMSNS